MTLRCELSGFNFWLGQLRGNIQTREQPRKAFLASDKFQTRVQQIIGQGCLN